MTVVNIVFLCVHLLCQPFRDLRSNRLETFSMTMLAVVSALMASFEDPLTSSQTNTFLSLLWISIALLGIPLVVRMLHKYRRFIPGAKACWKRCGRPSLLPFFSYLVASDYDPSQGDSHFAPELSPAEMAIKAAPTQPMLELAQTSPVETIDTKLHVPGEIGGGEPAS